MQNSKNIKICTASQPTSDFFFRSDNVVSSRNINPKSEGTGARGWLSCFFKNKKMFLRKKNNCLHHYFLVLKKILGMIGIFLSSPIAS